MDSKVLRRMSTDNSYWYNAAIFLLQSQKYGQSYHNLISKHLENQTPDISLLRLFSRLSSRLFSFDSARVKVRLSHFCFLSHFNKKFPQDIAPDQCESAGEFLLEPWVLLQLPFQPSMLHQWAVAVLAETLRFQKETVTIFTIGVPEELLEEVHLLKKMHKKLMEGAITLLSIFCNFSSQQDPENICKRVRRVREKLVSTITEVTPIVEFILSEKCQKVICGIKRASWSNKQKILHPTETDLDLGSYHVWYNPYFWNEGPMPSSLFSKRMYSLDQQKQFLQKLRLNMLSLEPEVSAALVQKFVQDRIIGKGVLAGASDAEILAVAAKAPEKLQFPCFDYFADLKGIYGQCNAKLLKLIF
jgi:hypothetical protein